MICENVHVSEEAEVHDDVERANHRDVADRVQHQLDGVAVLCMCMFINVDDSAGFFRCIQRERDSGRTTTQKRVAAVREREPKYSVRSPNRMVPRRQ